MPAPKTGLRRDSHGRPDVFWACVAFSADNAKCWTWLGGLNVDGYGAAGRELAHRRAWVLTFGPIPKRLCVLHRCDNRACCNPAHLFLGTRKINNADRDAKGRFAFGERVGTHKLTDCIVQDLRERYAAGKETHRSLAVRYGVHHTTIGDVLRGFRWRHVESRTL